MSKNNPAAEKLNLLVDQAGENERLPCLPTQIEAVVKAFDGKILVLDCPYDDEPFEVDLSEVDWTAPHSPHISDYLQRFYINCNITNGRKEIYWIEDAWA